MRTLAILLALATALTFTQGATADNSDSMNFRFSPVGVLIGALNASLDVAINEDWTLGPNVTAWNFEYDGDRSDEEIDVEAIGGGIRANWFKNGVYTNGLYVGPSLNYVKVDASVVGTNESISADTEGLFLSGIVGYGWFWDSFNMMLGGGLSVGLGDTEVTIRRQDDSEESVDTQRGGLAAEFSLGWTF